MATTEITRSRLVAAIEARRLELRMELGDLAAKADMSTAHLRRIRNGEQAVTPLKAAGLEDALRWARGSIASVEAGGDPSPVAAPAAAPGRDPHKTLGEMLIERGLARPEDLDVSDNVANDPVAWEIIELVEISSEARDEMLRAYANMRRVTFRAARAQKKRPRV